MKKLNFLTAIFSFIANLFNPIFEAAEKTFTLGVIESIPTSRGNGSSDGGARGADINVNVNTNPAYIDRSGDPIIDRVSSYDFVPDSYQYKNVNGSASGAAAITAYAFNEDSYNATVTNNGSGASTVTNTYADGWSGNGYNKQIASANAGRGVLCQGITMIYQVTSGSAQDAAGLASSNLQMLNFTLVGTSSATVPSPLNQGFNYGQYQIGTMTVVKRMFISCVTQFSYVVPVGDTVTFIALMNPRMVPGGAR